MGMGVATSQSVAQQQLRQRAIPVSGENIPVVGLGTWQSFDVGSDKLERKGLKDVLSAFVNGGGMVVDSSPMYGRSESVVGDLAEDLGIVSDLFMATKVWTSGRQAGIQQMEQSLQRMKTTKMDLMQVHNLLDAEVQLKTLTQWKAAGKIRYLGLTHYHSGGYSEMKRLILNHKVDFIQINYSMLSLEAEDELLPLAKDRGIAVLINRPFEAGSLFGRVKNRKLPAWSIEFDCHSWGQFFLKFILSNEAVTCVIPGTSKAHHLKDNLMAGTGQLPSRTQRQAMLQTVLNG